MKKYKFQPRDRVDLVWESAFNNGDVKVGKGTIVSIHGNIVTILRDGQKETQEEWHINWLKLNIVETLKANKNG